AKGGHRHTGIELSFIQSSSVHIQTEMWEGLAHQGQLILLGAQLHHTTRAVHGSYRRTVVHFSQGFVDRSFQWREVSEEFPGCVVTMSHDATQRFALVASVLDQMSRSWRDSYRPVARTLINQVLRDIVESASLSNSGRSGFDLVRDVICY